MMAYQGVRIRLQQAIVCTT